MCGIVGFFRSKSESHDALRTTVRRMADSLIHRGPDDSGEWVDAACGVALGFRRLAILDLSPGGHQPMVSAGGRFTIVFNGEIYNFRDLKVELLALGHSFRSESDTEVILTGCLQWGIVETLRRIEGMFGLAIWDSNERTLTLARDRVGKKPIYYGSVDGVWIFGSELKALRAFSSRQLEIDSEALAAFMRFSYVPGDQSIYKQIHKLPAAQYICISSTGTTGPRTYWDAQRIMKEGELHPLNLSDREATDQLDARLLASVARRMVSDVPLGAFLSGGIDSSVVVGMMQAQSAVPVKTFTIGFDVPGYNEAESAKAVAAHLGTDHHEMYVTPGQARDVIPLLPDMYDEPFADSSQIPTYLLSHLTRRHVTVGLSGDGGDELLGGYNRYAWAPRIWKALQYAPLPIRRAIAAAIAGVPAPAIDRLYHSAEFLLPSNWRVRLPGDKAHKLSRVLDSASQDDLYARLVSAWQNPPVVSGGGKTTSPPLGGAEPNGFLERMMYRDLLTYLPDDILVKVDRASMAVSLEARCPLLDSRLIEWSWSLPSSFKVRGGVSKWLLRQVLDRYVPRHLVERPKMGFGVPVDEWLRGPLRAWAEELLSIRALEAGGLLVAAPIRQVWQRHLSGYHNEQARLWPVLMFQAWRNRWA